MPSAGMVSMIFWLLNAIYLGVSTTVHETRDTALHLTHFFPHPHFPRCKPHCDEAAGYLISPTLYSNSSSLITYVVQQNTQLLLWLKIYSQYSFHNLVTYGRTEQRTILTYQTSNTQFIDAPAEDGPVGPNHVEPSNIL